MLKKDELTEKETERYEVLLKAGATWQEALKAIEHDRTWQERLSFNGQVGVPVE